MVPSRLARLRVELNHVFVRTVPGGPDTEEFGRFRLRECALRTPLLMHHPYPTHRLSLPSYPLPESKPDETTQAMKKKEGVSAKGILRLPDPWPPADD